MQFCTTATALLGVYPKDTKMLKGNVHPMFIAALSTIAKVWKEPRCPSMDKWIKKMWYMYICLCVYIYIYIYIYTHTHTHTHARTDTHTPHTLEYYSAIKKNEILPFATMWMELEGIMLSEISQRKTKII